MSVSEDFLGHLRDLFSGLGPIGAKRMFSGVGLYLGDDIFAIAIDDVLYLKTDAETRGLFQQAGARPFVYARKDGREIETSYWSLPDAALDDPDEAVAWARRALETARRKPVKRGR